MSCRKAKKVKTRQWYFTQDLTCPEITREMALRMQLYKKRFYDAKK